MTTIPVSEKLKFYRASLKKNQGPLWIGLTFIILGLIVAYIGYFVAEVGFLTGFGLFFIAFSGFFLMYTMPSSIAHYYDQEVTKKYGSYTTAKVIDKRIDDYSHTSSIVNSGQAVHHEEFLFAIIFEFTYKNNTYSSECFFEHKETYEAIAIGSELPIQFLRHEPNTITLRRRKLSNELGIAEKLCQ